MNSFGRMFFSLMWLTSKSTLSHMHERTTFFKTHFVHECLHQIDAAPVRGVTACPKIKRSLQLLHGWFDPEPLKFRGQFLIAHGIRTDVRVNILGTDAQGQAGDTLTGFRHR